MRMPLHGSRGLVVLVVQGTEDRERRANQNHGQTLERLAERGGLGWDELLAVVMDVPYAKVRGVGLHAARQLVLETPGVAAIGCAACQRWGIPPPLEGDRCVDCGRPEREIRDATAT